MKQTFKEIRVKLSEISTMKYDLQKNSKIKAIAKLENKIRTKFNIKESEKLRNIEYYTSQVYFDFAKTWLMIDCDNRELTFLEKKMLEK